MSLLNHFLATIIIPQKLSTYYVPDIVLGSFTFYFYLILLLALKSDAHFSSYIKKIKILPDLVILPRSPELVFQSIFRKLGLEYQCIFSF
jgi:hypothetical protein